MGAACCSKKESGDQFQFTECQPLPQGDPCCDPCGPQLYMQPQKQKKSGGGGLPCCGGGKKKQNNDLQCCTPICLEPQPQCCGPSYQRQQPGYSRRGRWQRPNIYSPYGGAGCCEDPYPCDPYVCDHPYAFEDPCFSPPPAYSRYRSPCGPRAQSCGPSYLPVPPPRVCTQYTVKRSQPKFC